MAKVKIVTTVEHRFKSGIINKELEVSLDSKNFFNKALAIAVEVGKMLNVGERVVLYLGGVVYEVRRDNRGIYIAEFMPVAGYRVVEE